jgi:hypothetical protein
MVRRRSSLPKSRVSAKSSKGMDVRGARSRRGACDSGAAALPRSRRAIGRAAKETTMRAHRLNPPSHSITRAVQRKRSLLAVFALTCAGAWLSTESVAPADFVAWNGFREPSQPTAKTPALTLGANRARHSRLRVGKERPGERTADREAALRDVRRCGRSRYRQL